MASSKMCLFAFIILILAGVSVAQLDKCWECKHGWVSPDECNNTATETSCPGNDQFICSISVKNDGGKLGMRRGCSNVNACHNNRANNDQGCNNGTISESGKCVYCCSDSHLCNYDELNYSSASGARDGMRQSCALYLGLTLGALFYIKLQG